MFPIVASLPSSFTGLFFFLLCLGHTVNGSETLLTLATLPPIRPTAEFPSSNTVLPSP